MAESILKSFSSQYRKGESTVVKQMLESLSWDGVRSQRVEAIATAWVKQLRQNPPSASSVEGMMQRFPLNTEEGLALMTLAEALLRIPDTATQDALIADKVTSAMWAGPAQGFIGAGLSVAKISLKTGLGFISKPAIRASMRKAMRSMGTQFVLGEDAFDAFVNASPYEAKGSRLSYDMLGEGARTQSDADRYFNTYLEAIRLIGSRNHNGAPKTHNVGDVPGISVKLSALYPRYEPAQHEACIPALSAQLLILAQEAARYNIALTVDAEESERLPLSLCIIDRVLSDASLEGWDGFGLAVQAYNTRALDVLDFIIKRAKALKRRVQIRLVKGAYWDREIKHAQTMGVQHFPVFTRKSHSDISYLACAYKMLQNADVIDPLFGTHNAHSIAAIIDMAQELEVGFELQRLHGMGEALFDIITAQHADIRTSIYAPVGPQEDLLPYLVRRLLENGANSSFVNQIMDDDVPPQTLLQDPIQRATPRQFAPHDKIKPPADIFAEQDRTNAAGTDYEDVNFAETLLTHSAYFAKNIYEAPCIIDGREERTTTAVPITSPADTRKAIGRAYPARSAHVTRAVNIAQAAFEDWNTRPPHRRVQVLEAYADLLESHRGQLLYLLQAEAGKTLPDAINEIREAVDFARYYAAQGQKVLAPQAMPGPAGESNLYTREGRGVFACISPWNFPLAIFSGQITAALMAGNSVVAKPAEQTPLIAAFVVKLLHKSGVPASALNLIIGDGFVGENLVAQPDIAGVAFTGSSAAAKAIQQSLAAKQGPIVPLIAETGGQNAMIVDSSALLEQVCDDVMTSAFGSAGQRCSALRILCVQDDIAAPLLRLLTGAMQDLKMSPNVNLSADLGPVIDADAKTNLLRHIAALDVFATKIHQAPLDKDLAEKGHFIAPSLYEVRSFHGLEEEHFGPILHVLRYRKKDLPDVLGSLNGLGYGLTLGIHSRIQSFIDTVSASMKVGNIYVNRSMIGAVVGSQPFGGHGLSGTGPKAGGPDYLRAFMQERVISTDTTAAGGNVSLVSLAE